MGKNLQIYFESGKKLSHLKANTFTKNRWKVNKRSVQSNVKFVPVLWRVIF